MSKTISDELRHESEGFHSCRLARRVLVTGPWMSVHGDSLRRKTKRFPLDVSFNAAKSFAAKRPASGNAS